MSSVVADNGSPALAEQIPVFVIVDILFPAIVPQLQLWIKTP